jgi:hypothetical protein
MRVQPDGDLEIAHGEVVTVTVTANNTHYLAIFSNLLSATWTILQPVHQAGPNSIQETRSFVAGAGSQEAFALSLDFVRNQAGATNPGAEYFIDVQGNLPPFGIRKRIVPIPPFPVGRPFVFEVV